MKKLRKRIMEWKALLQDMMDEDPNMGKSLTRTYKNRITFYNKVLKLCDQADIEGWDESEDQYIDENGKVK